MVSRIFIEYVPIALCDMIKINLWKCPSFYFHIDCVNSSLTFNILLITNLVIIAGDVKTNFSTSKIWGFRAEME